jgi:PTS system cellobiose-specific IIC component
LPQTGEKNNKLGILGLLSVLLASLFFSSLADAFMKVTPITLGGAFVLLIGNFPIPAWTNFLQKIGWATQFNAAQNATMNVYVTLCCI